MSKKSEKKKSSGQKVTTASKGGTKAQKKWVVGIDPFSDLNSTEAIEFFKRSADRRGATLYGTYVLAPESLNWTGEFSGPWIKKYKPVAEAKAAELGRKLGIKIEVVPCRQPGLKHAVETLTKYATKIKAECITICTHARHGLERWMLGSYAESIILSAKIPVLVLNPSQSIPASVKRILVPTDLSPQSTKFVLQVAAFAQAMGASVELLYKQPDPLDPIIQQGVYAVGGGWVSVQSYLEDDLAAKEKKVSDLLAGLRKRGLDANSSIVTASTSLVNSIEQTAEERNCDMIAVLTQSGAIAATVLGSVARGLVRSAKVPIMVWH